MASHGGPMLDLLDVIKHDPRVLQISSGLHSFDQVHSGSGPHLEHLEKLKTNTLSESEPCHGNLFS
jgi:hypothetical protein